VAPLFALACCAGWAGSTPAATRSLDALVERPSAWTRPRAERFDAERSTLTTHGTPASLLTTWRKDLGDVAGKGVFETSQSPSTWLRLPDDLDLARFTRLRLWARIGAHRHAHLGIMLATEATLSSGVRHAHGDLSEEQRRSIRWLGIWSINVGHHPDEPPVLKVWLDDVRLTDEALRPTRGWTTDPSVVVVNQLGFRRRHRKLAVVSGTAGARSSELLSVPSNEVVERGDLEVVESAVGRNLVADFTAFTTPGRYRVRAGSRLSLPFVIGDEAWEPAVGALADWVLGMRCGY